VARVPFNHVRAGSGEPLVLIHGVGHHWQGWKPVIGLLTDRFEVIAVDSPGFGQSEPLPPGTPATIDSYTDAFAAWLEEAGLERPHVAGNSMGGGIALELARRGLVRSANAISPVGFWTDGERRYCQLTLGILGGTPAPIRPAMLRLAGSPAGRAALFGVVFARPGRTPAEEARLILTDAWASPAMNDALAGFDHYDFENGRELTGAPITVAWGSRDRLLFYGKQAPRARAALPQARHVTMPGLGHSPSYDDPGVVAHVLRAGAGAT
jgi:pimeloyl-ACP methyl ester carboxylesterase